MYKDTVTLFCRKVGDRDTGDTWYPTILPNVNLMIDRASIVSRYGPESNDSAVLSVKYIPDGKNKRVGKKLWKAPTEWENPETEITFRSGNNFDFFWLGEWDGGAVSDRDYKGGFYQHMNQNHDFVFAVSSVSYLTMIPHFEVTGR